MEPEQSPIIPYPYQEGDFIKGPNDSRNPKEIAFIGPIYHVHYPAQCDAIQEALDWQGLGYRLPTSFTYDESKGFTLIVLGDIPEWAQATLQEHKIRIELQKPRGIEAKL
jgi:hypothetical protein